MSVPRTNPSFWRDRTVVVTGGAGFLGSHVVRRLESFGARVVVPRHAEHDLTKHGVAEKYFATHKPSHIIHLAARVGGIEYNQAEPAPLFLDNLQMGVNVIEAARTAGVEKTTILGTVCSYPKFTPVPFREESIWDGYPEETNAPYGIAKKALLVHAQVNNQQYGQRFAFVIPTNLYGPGDKFHESVSHVIPALIKKCVEAKECGVDKVHVWGTGAASRDYLYVSDAAAAIVLAAELHDGTEPLNLGNNQIEDAFVRFKALADDYGAQLRITRLRPSGRGVDSWNDLRKLCFTVTALIFIGFAIVLAAWGFLEFWNT